MKTNSLTMADKAKDIIKPQPLVKFYEEAVIESEARTAVAQLKSES